MSFREGEKGTCRTTLAKTFELGSSIFTLDSRGVVEFANISIIKGANNYLPFLNYDRFLRQNPQVSRH